MKLADLLRDVPLVSVDGPLDLEIASVREDSRAVRPGDLFAAVPGLTVDGHDYLAAAAAAGASAAIVEREIPASTFPGTRVRVASAAHALALAAAHHFGDPAASMRLTAVTGTNGKTTTTYLLEAILTAAGRRPGVIGTVNYRYPSGDTTQTVPAPFTTPTALQLHAILAEMKSAGVTDVVMETSSHALALGRLAGVTFHAAGFTNLTQDHLDFHGTMEAYFDAKAILFRQQLRPESGAGVIFLDDAYGPKMAAEVAGKRLTVSIASHQTDVFVKHSQSTLAGITAELASPIGPLHLRSRLIGRYNLANLSVAAGLAIALGIDADAIERGIADQPGVPGRIERVELPVAMQQSSSPARPSTHPNHPIVLVDYAHTHDALENVIAALRPLTPGRLLCVFGCGGDRDKTKRPKMGRVVARDADLAIVTSDNPRTEDPDAIIALILDGVRETQTPMLADPGALATAPRGAFIEPDRKKAIEAAVCAAQQNDVVLIAGKGHEDYQIIGRTKHPFDDREIARAALARRISQTSSHQS